MTAVTVPVPPSAQRLIDAQTNALLQELVTATPTQVAAYMTSNVTTIAQAQSVLTSLALAIRYLYLVDQ